MAETEPKAEVYICDNIPFTSLQAALNKVKDLPHLIDCLLQEEVIDKQEHFAVVYGKETLRHQISALLDILAWKDIGYRVAVISAFQQADNVAALQLWNDDYESLLESNDLRTFVAFLPLEHVEAKLRVVDSLEELVALDEDSQTSLHVCFYRNDEIMECLNLLVAKFKELAEKERRSDNTESEARKEPTWTLQKYVDHQSKSRRQTAAHLAAQKSMEEVLYALHACCCRFFLEDSDGCTAMQLMYLYAPEAVLHILHDGILTKNDLSDSGSKISFDFNALIGLPSEAAIDNRPDLKALAVNVDEADLDKTQPLEKSKTRHVAHAETALLAELIDQNKEGAKIILDHVIIKLFLEFKWDKMKYWFWMATVAQISLHLVYILFVIQVFLVECQYQSSSSLDSNSNRTNANLTGAETEVSGTDVVLPKMFYNYLLGSEILTAFKQVFDPKNDANARECQLEGATLAVAGGLFIFGGVLLLLKEMLELYLKLRAKNVSDVLKGCGVFSYLFTTENFLQLLTIVSVFWVTVPHISSRNMLNDSHYSWASIAVVVSCTLILVHLGIVFPKLGLNVQILGKVIKRFLALCGVYIVFIIAFSISFSIMFPHEKPFETLPQAVAKVIVMMTGEFEYNDLFLGEGPKIPLTSHVMFACFAMLLTIILINLLIGMVVNDIQELRSRSQVVQLSIKIDQIFVMENSLLRLQSILLPLQQMLNFFCRKLSLKEFNKNHLDIYVISHETPREFNSGTTPSSGQSTKLLSSKVGGEAKPVHRIMTIEKSMDEIPLDLQQELLKFVKSRTTTANASTTSSESQ